MNAELVGPPAHAPAEPCGCASCGAGPKLPRGVHLFSGEFVVSVEDLRIAGRGLDFGWSRKYLSRSGPDTAQGNRWDFSYNVRVEALPDGHVRLFNGDGRADDFRRGRNGLYWREEFFAVGRMNRNGTSVFTFPDTGTWTFRRLDGRPGQGKISAITDRNGNGLSFEYDGKGRLVRILDTLGRPILVSYARDGRIAALTDFTGRRVTYAYYGDGESGGSGGDLKSVCRPGAPLAPAGPAPCTTYTYSTGYKEPVRNHNLLTITSPNGQRLLTNSYSAVRVGDGPQVRLKRQVRGDGSVTDYSYEPMQPSAKNRRASLLATVTDGARNVKDYIFDDRNRCLQVREYTGRAPKRGVTTAHVNRPTGRLRPTDPAAFETRFEWNEDSLVTRIVHPNGSVTSRQYQGETSERDGIRLRGNLRRVRVEPGPLGGDQPALVRRFEYAAGFGCSCAENFVSESVDPRGNVTRRAYDHRGNLLRIEYPLAGSVEEFAYDQHGQLTRHVHPDNGSGHRRADTFVHGGKGDRTGRGRLIMETIDAEALALSTRHEHDALGRVTRTVSPRGASISLSWNDADRVVRELLPASGSSTRLQLDHGYDANGNRIRTETREVDKRGHVQSGPIAVTTREYDALDRCIRVSRWVSAKHKLAVEFAYDANGNRTLVRSGEATNGNQPANVVALAYDERDLPFRKMRAPGDRLQSTTQYDYEPSRNLIRLRTGLEGQPREQRRTYDGYGRVRSHVDAMGSTVRLRYDPNGNIVAEEFEGHRRRNAVSRQPPAVVRATHEFDAMDRRVRSTRLAGDRRRGTRRRGVAVRIEYGPASDVLRVREGDGRETHTTYDTARRISSVGDGRGNSVRYAYDADSNVVELTELERSDAGGPEQRFVTTVGRDAVGRVTRIVDPLGNLHRYEYDARGNRALVVDPAGKAVQFTHDGVGRVVSATRLADRSSAGARPISVHFAWDDSSRLVGRTDPNGNTTSYSYDPLNREVAVLYADGSMASFTHDVHGDRVTSRDPNGSRITTRYDALGRPVDCKVVPGRGVATTGHERFEYDAWSRLVLSQNNDAVVVRHYDDEGNLVREEQNGQAVSFSHDAAGNRIRVTGPSGRRVDYSFDSLRRIVLVRDERGPIARYRHAGLSRLAAHEIGRAHSALVTRFTYDHARRLIEVTRTAKGGVFVLADEQHAWDAASNRVGRTCLRDGVPVASQRFAYDVADRMVLSTTTDRAGAAASVVRYVLDGAGNRLTVSGGDSAGRYRMDRARGAAVLHKYTSTPFDRRKYDRNGNLVALRRADGTLHEFRYDHRDRLVEFIDRARRRRVQFRYDALGRRVARRVVGDPSASTRSFFDGWRLIEEQNESGRAVATYVHGPGMNDVLSVRRGHRDLFLHKDDLQTVLAVTDDTGRRIESYAYDDFGAPSIGDARGTPLSASAIGNPHLFGGHVYDPDLGLYDCRTRFFDPRAGRFLSRDTIGLWGDAGSLGNGYTYARNNPHTFLDPMGESILRTIPCSGPWPGPASVTIEYEGCSSSRRATLDSPVCRAFRGSARAFADVQDVWLTDLTGTPIILSPTGASPSSTRQRLKKWFGGPDNATSIGSKQTIASHLSEVFDALDANDVDIDCESCSDANAYVNWGGYDVNVCPPFFNSGFSTRKQAAILVHELTHAYADTDDYCYYPTDGVNLPWNLLFETTTLRENGDTYEQFVLEFYT